MTECEYPALFGLTDGECELSLYGLTDGECGLGVRWCMVAGTTACPETLEFRLCSVHTTMCTAVQNLPSRLRDIHGHRMEEVILRDLGVPGGEDIVLLNYLEQPGEDLAWPLPRPRCPVCGKPYGTAIEAMACAYRDRRLALPRPQWAAS